MTKHMKLVIAACSMLAMASCGSKSGETTLENTNGLLALQTEVNNSDTLMGVRTIFDTIQVVPMAKWDSIRACDAKMVKAYRDGKLYAYTATGKQLGKGDLKELVTVTTSLSDSTTFYRGMNAADSTHVFYFPTAESIIDGIDMTYIGRTVMLMQTSRNWEVRNYSGELKWTTNDKNVYIIRRIHADEETFNIVEVRNYVAVIYSIEGERLREAPIKEWQKATKSFRRMAQIGEATYGELDINYAI